MNNLNVDDVPTELGSLKKLKQILMAQRILFEKVIVMRKGQQRKIKGAICNVPVNCDQICKILPRPPERSGIILLKLKKTSVQRTCLFSTCYTRVHNDST